jgi:hypothetical protein
MSASLKFYILNFSLWCNIWYLRFIKTLEFIHRCETNSLGQYLMDSQRNGFILWKILWHIKKKFWRNTLNLSLWETEPYGKKTQVTIQFYLL